MSSGADDNRCIDGVGVHAGLVIMMHGDQGPVRDHASDPDDARGTRGAGDEVFNGRGIEEFDVRE